MCFFFFKQKTAYEMRISDWSSDVCSSDLPHALVPIFPASVSATDLVGVDMRQLAFDRIGMPLSHLVQKRGCHRPETMGGHLVAGIAEPAPPRIDRLLGHSPARMPQTRTQVLPPMGVLMRFLHHPQASPKP